MIRFAWKAIAATAILALPAAAQPAPKLIPLRVAYDGYSMTTAPMNYALQKGIFKKYGLDVTLVYIDGGTTLSQAVIGGSVSIAQNGYTPAAAAAVQGADIVFIGGISNKLPFQLVVRKEIKTGADLKGKKLAISRLGSSSDTAATYALRYFSMKRPDVVLLQLGGEATRTAAMLSGQIDGSFEQYPRTAELEEKGYHVLVDLTDVAGDYPNTSYVSTRAFIKKSPDVVKRFTMAITDGIHTFKMNKAEAMKITSTFLKTPEGPALAETYDRFTRDVYPDIPRPSLKGIALVLAELKTSLPKAGMVKPEQLVDTTAFDKLEKEGFFAKLQ